MLRLALLLPLVFLLISPTDAGTPKKRVLLLWQSPDGHPKETHEYQLGQKILKRELDKFASLELSLANADEPWKDGPDLLAKADAVVLFVSEGARWVSAEYRLTLRLLLRWRRQCSRLVPKCCKSCSPRR